jgi:glycosyltransferase involved in cell wall biosynthesis
MNQITPIQPHIALQATPALFCFSHLRWDFVHQRPQHLMERAAKTHRVFFIEEPVPGLEAPHCRMRFEPSGVTVVTPVLPEGCDALEEQNRLVAGLTRAVQPSHTVHWYYTPLAMRFAADLPRDLTVYDCMDELSAFRFAPPGLIEEERRLVKHADLVFTGGASLYAAKAGLHRDVHCFPSSVDTAHFSKARASGPDPVDQAGIAWPRIGYFGVIDERMDLGLVAQAAAALPDVQFIMLGPVVKVDRAALPLAANLHWLGRKSYDELPAYMAHWQAAWMPFALNESTRFISPTKTPEFLAAGLPVTSTAVADVVSDWGREGLVRIADAGTMADALRDSLAPPSSSWRARVDARLADLSWDRTWAAMSQKMAACHNLLVTS